MIALATALLSNRTVDRGRLTATRMGLARAGTGVVALLPMRMG